MTVLTQRQQEACQRLIEEDKRVTELNNAGVFGVTTPAAFAGMLLTVAHNDLLKAIERGESILQKSLNVDLLKHVSEAVQILNEIRLNP